MNSFARRLAVPDDEPTEWMAEGLCRKPGIPDRALPAWVDLWFPNQPGSGQGSLGRVICRQCPVRTECGEYAIARPELRGTWGATTWTDRAGIRNVRDGARRPSRNLSSDAYFFLP